MPEYRRFVAYFYEYIDGKKQKNAGFAKVELRNGMWRVLFRLTVPNALKVFARVYGFVRENGYLLGLPLGNMSMNGQNTEEWAWRADVPVGFDRYYFGQLSGIWVENPDGRTFITVWDDEALDPKQFVLEIPEQETEKAVKSAEREADLSPMEEPEPGVIEVPPEKPTEDPGTVEVPLKEPADDPGPGVIEVPPEKPIEEPEPMAVPSEPDTEIPAGKNCVEALLRSRQHFHPFTDEEISDCVQIRMCDLVSLQQEGWQVGRSNFLWHGYSQYRHLLLGRYRKEGYVLGVPGVFSRQEEYVAGVFEYGQFKASSLGGCGRRLGYWCRVLSDPEQAVVPEFLRGSEQVAASEPLRGSEQVAVSEPLRGAEQVAVSEPLRGAKQGVLSMRGKAEISAFLREKEREGSMWN